MDWRGSGVCGYGLPSLGLSPNQRTGLALGRVVPLVGGMG